MSTTTPARPWWHRFAIRLSVRALLALVLAVGIVAWLLVAPGFERHRATGLIRRHNGTYLHDYQFSPLSGYAKNPRSPYPAWARKALTDDHFHDVTLVFIQSPDFDDEDLGRLRPLDRVDTMRLDRAAISADGLKRFRDFPRLRQLYLNGCNITDAAIENLGDEVLSRLVFLGLQDTPVSQAKVDELRERHPKLTIIGKPRFVTTVTP